ncbi:BadF/BadG/BcrA/BcrD ATPase family protein [Oerskovia sp. USHLN155]|uniref:BadF/BadG/BcrA/BcrD ATPase family protein n=1 Tax=Oerskovia sp. USHLN155 TaxID=3081288 RepID=UPI003018D31C
MSIVVGVDIGGTKTHVRVACDEERLVDLVVPSTGWAALPSGAAARWVAERVHVALGRCRPALRLADVAHLAVGAHGCETPRQCATLADELHHLLDVRCTVVNDAQLLVPAAGLDEGIGLVAGTGSVAVGRHRETGTYLSAGGWGWVLGDDGSASALVRDAARALFVRADVGATRDPLEPRLLASFGAEDLVELASIMSWRGGVETWGRHAPVVFRALEAGSQVSRAVVTAGGGALAELVGNLIYRGAAGTTVVVAGGVVTRQQALRTALADALARRAPHTTLHLLEEDPVEGAVFLARRSIATDRGALSPTRSNVS